MILRESDLPELARKLRPYLLPDMRAIGTSGGRNTSTGGVATMATHELASTSALGAYHTVSGLTAGQVLKATASNAASFGALNHNQLGGIGANDHHSQQHSITGSDHTLTASQYQVVGATATNTLGLLTPSADVSAGGTSLLRSDAGALGVASLTAATKARTPLIDTASGDLALSPASGVVTAGALHASTRVRTPEISTASGNLVLAPASGITTASMVHASTNLRAPLLENASGDLKLNASTNLLRIQPSVRIQSDNYISQSTGWGIDYAGGADFRYLFADELHAKSFIADLEQALAGGQIISKSVAVVYADFTLPATGSSTTFVVRDLPSATGMAVFVNGDYARFRKFSRAGGALTIADAWGTVTLDTSYGTSGFDSATKTQRYTFSRSSGAQGGTATGTINADAIVLDYGTSGNGLYEVNAIDGAYALNSPYLQFIKWTTHPQNGQVVRLRLGNLRGITAQADEYGLYAGSGITDSDQYIRLSSYTNRINNLPMQWWSSGAKFAWVDSVDGYNLESSSAYATLRGFSFWTGAGAVERGGLYSMLSSPYFFMKLGGRPSGNPPDGYAHYLQLAAEHGGGTTNGIIDLIAYGTGGNSIQMLLRSSTETVEIDGSLEVSGTATNALVVTQGISAARINATGTSVLPVINYSSGVQLQYNGSTKLAVVSTGVNITGAISAADATLTGALTVQTIDHASGPNLQYGGSTKLAIVSTGATVTGVLTTSGDMVIGSSDSTPSLTIGQAAALSTGDASIELGYGRTGSGNSYIDIVGDATYTDYGLRIIRANSGADAPSSIIHRGTGDLNLRTNEAGAIKLRTNNTLRATVQSSGELIAEYGVYVNGDQGGISGYVGLTDVTTGISTGTGTVRMNSTSSGVASAGWLKAYVGTTTIYIPYWTSMS